MLYIEDNGLIEGRWPDGEGVNNFAFGHTMREMRSWAAMIDADDFAYQVPGSAADVLRTVLGKEN